MAAAGGANPSTQASYPKHGATWHSAGSEKLTSRFIFQEKPLECRPKVSPTQNSKCLYPYWVRQSQGMTSKQWHGDSREVAVCTPHHPHTSPRGCGRAGPARGGQAGEPTNPGGSHPQLLDPPLCGSQLSTSAPAPISGSGARRQDIASPPLGTRGGGHGSSDLHTHSQSSCPTEFLAPEQNPLSPESRRRSL